MSVDADSEIDASFVAEVRTIARDVAAAHGDDVDREARFPSETIDALRAIGGLSAHVPVELGGRGVSLPGLAVACFELGRSCASSAMVFAMHQIQVACIVRHRAESAWFVEYLERLCSEQRLISSCTSEVGTGGDMTRSIAGLASEEPGTASFEKQATTVSYGQYSDDVLTTVRRSLAAEPNDQLLVLSSSEQTEFAQKGTWDPLGMRGTCSPGFVVRATMPDQQVLPVPFGVIAAESMVPISHLLWAHLWLGIATDAFDRARSFTRERARGERGAVPAGGELVSELLTDLSLLRAEIGSVLAMFDAADAEPGRPRLSTMTAALRFNNLKIAASETCSRICLDALGAIGILGYKNDTPYSVGRHVRDSLSAPLMVSNARIHATNASLLLIAKEV